MRFFSRVLVFCIVWLFFLVFSSSAYADYRVRPVFIIPSDWQAKVSQTDLNHYKTAIVGSLQEVQNFYRNKLNGKTFNIDSNAQVIYSSRAIGDVREGNLGQVVQQLAPELSNKESGVIRVIFVLGTGNLYGYNHGEPYRWSWGWPDGSDAGATLMGEVQLHELVDLDAGNAVRRSRVAILAHELGHAFGLNYIGYSRAHTCWTQYPDECDDFAPLPLPDGEEAAHSIMSYNDTYRVVGLDSSLLRGFNNSIWNPEVKKLYESPFINPNHEPAPEPTSFIERPRDFTPETAGLHLLGTVISNSSAYHKENNPGDQGSKSTYILDDGSEKRIDWTPVTGSENPPIYIREVYSDHSFKDYSISTNGKTEIKVGRITIALKGIKKVVTKITINGTDVGNNLTDFNQNFSGLGLLVDLTQLQSRVTVIKVEYSNGDEKTLAIDFTPFGNSAQCTENRTFCQLQSDGRVRKIHHGDGVMNGAGQCVYADVDQGDCNQLNGNPLEMDAVCYTTGKLELLWHKVENASKYQIRVDKDPVSWSGANTNGDIVDDNPTLRESDNILVYDRENEVRPRQTVSWWIHAIDKNGKPSEAIHAVDHTCSGDSSSAPVVSSCPNGLCKPQLTLSSHDGQVYASWSKVDGAAFYAIRYGTNEHVPDVDQNDRYGNVDTTSYSHSCQSGKTYFFWVHPMKGEGQYGDAEISSVTCEGNTQQCSYPETCNGTGIRICTGTIQSGICKYDPAVSPACGSCANGSSRPSVTTCSYPESCNNGADTHTCTGTLQQGACKYDPSVSPNCSTCSNSSQPQSPSGPGEGSSCTYPEQCTRVDGGGGVHTCRGTIQGGVCKYAGGAASDICSNCQ